MPFFDKLHKLTSENYIFPIEVSFIGKIDEDGKRYNEFKRKAGSKSPRVYGVKVVEGKVESKATQLEIFNKEVVAEYVALLNRFADEDFKEEFENNALQLSRNRKVVFLPQNLTVAQELFQAVEEWLNYNNAVQVYGSHRILKTLSAGFPVFNEDSVEEGLEDFIENLENPHSRNIVNTLSPKRNSLVIEGEEPYRKNYPFKNITSLECKNRAFSDYYYGEIDKNSLKVLFDEPLLRFPHFLALNEFIEHGKKGQNLKEYIATEAGIKSINDCLKNGAPKFYSHTKNLMCILVEPKSSTDTNFLSLNFSSGMKFIQEKVGTLSARELLMWVENHKLQPYFDLSSSLKKSFLEDWVWQLSKPQSELNKEYKILDSLKLSGKDKTSKEVINSDSVSTWLYENVAKENNLNLEDYREQELAQEILQRAKDFLNDRTYRCNEKSMLFLFNNLLHRALENSANKDRFDVSAFSYFIILDSIAQTKDYMRNSSFNSFSVVLYKTLENVNYNLDSLAQVLYTLRTNENIPDFTAKTWSQFLDATPDVSTKNDTELELILPIFTSSTVPNRNTYLSNKQVAENWEFLYKLHKNKPLYLLNN